MICARDEFHSWLCRHPAGYIAGRRAAGVRQTIRQAAQGLLELINDILDFSRIEAGKLKIEIISCDIAKIVQEIHGMLEMQARTKGLDFLIEIDKQLPPTLFTDPTRLKQCLINLIGNAVKFTDSGHVALRIVADNRAEQPCVRFDVEDTGIGIAPDKQEVIFKSFSQADISTSRQYGGTGLGLTITRQLAGLLGGDIRLTSEPGRGSTFSLTLPLFVPKPAENGLAAVGRRARQRTTMRPVALIRWQKRPSQSVDADADDAPLGRMQLAAGHSCCRRLNKRRLI